jgi:hypothetical protein
MQTTRKPNESGRLWIENSIIHYESEHYGQWTSPVSEVLLVGEYTNDHGPYLDDWFYVFMVAGQNWFEASMYAKESDSFRGDLKQALGADITTGLASSTEFRSRVMWPVSLCGKPIFDFRKVQGASIARRIRLAILPEIQFCLTRDVEDYLKGLPNQASQPIAGRPGSG